MDFDIIIIIALTLSNIYFCSCNKIQSDKIDLLFDMVNDLKKRKETN